MSAIDATNTLAQAHAQAIQTAAPTEESLNAGALLPDEPIPDVLTNTVAGEPAVVLEMLAKLEDTPAVATESFSRPLQYLRQDLLAQRGMNQRIALEALQILPNFGQGRPVNYYSRLPSATGYTMALEEIDAGLKSDLLGQLASLTSRLETIASNPGRGHVIENLEFKRRSDQVCMQAAILDDFIKLTGVAGFTWDDACFRGCAVDPSQNATVPAILTVNMRYPNSLATMDEYYRIHLGAPALLETMTLHLNQWRNVFNYALEVFQEDADKISVETPKAEPSVLDAADAFQAAEDKIQEPTTERTTLMWLKDVGNAAEQAKVEDILNRAKGFVEAASGVADVLKAISAQLLTTPSNPQAVNDLSGFLEAFAKTSDKFDRAFGQMIKWCVNAGVATSYVGALAERVAEHAWKSVNQCQDTMQMPETMYDTLKTMVLDLQAPVKTNVL
jgi:hypothetical protein